MALAKRRLFPSHRIMAANNWKRPVFELPLVTLEETTVINKQTKFKQLDFIELLTLSGNFFGTY